MNPNNFFDAQYSQEDLQRRVAQRRANVPSRTSSMSLLPSTPGSQMNHGSMDMTGMMGGGDSLDDIIMQNNNEMRRQSIPQGYGNQDDRRTSMMEFGSGNGSLNGFQFGPTTAAPVAQGIRRQSAGELDMNAGFPDMSSMSGAMSMAGQPMGFSSPMQSQGPLTMNTNSPYSQISSDMMGNMLGFAPMGMEGMTEEDANVMNSGAIGMFSPSQFSQSYGPPPNMSQMNSDFMMQQNMPQSIPQRRNSVSSHDGLPNMNNVQMPDSPHVTSPTVTSLSQNVASYASPAAATIHHGLPSQPQNFNTPAGSEAPVATQPNEIGPVPPPKVKYDGIYSSSGFDMLGALMKVATRENPEIELGKVDLSCAFVVCDLTQYDCPIIYVSDNFEKLTGYNKHEIRGQNCRFLQAPDGKVEAGARRPFVDNDSVYYLREKIAEKKEAQRSLINYRKGGQPFMNLLTMIPITGETGDELRYIVGFQVDLVQKPSSFDGANKTTGGHWSIDYSQQGLPPFVWVPPENPRADGAQTVSRDDVSMVLNAVNTNTESDLTKRMWDKILLENTDDVIHVLSLKGLFLYLSPSSRHVLEYDASELVGTALSSVCHPSDIVPVTRELKDTSAGASVNVVFRIRRKRSGYTWFESHGSLCVEQGKGRKCIILVGRERPVYALQRREIEAAGGIGESEMWTKLSTSGMFLYAPSNIRMLLDRDPKDLIGTSFQQLMRKESQVEFGRALEKARTGKRVTHKHDIFNRKGLVLQAQTTLYPGDAAEGTKPTFLVGQTRLLKSSSRSVAPALASHTSHASGTSMSPNSKRDHMSQESTPISHPSNLSNMSSMNQESTPKSTPSIPGVISQAGGPGLQIGSQDQALASEDNIFDELKTTRCTSWQFELRQMEKSNRLLTEELAALLQSKKKRKRRKGNGNPARDCANCHTKSTPEWRRGPSGQRDLCNSCGLRWAKQTGRVSPRTSRTGDNIASKQSQSTSPAHSSPLQQEVTQSSFSENQRPNLNPDPNSSGKMKGESAAMPGSLGGRTTVESIPVHMPSLGYREGGSRGITNIDERDERGS